MIADNLNNTFPYYSELAGADYLPKWAADEKIYNCENAWKSYRLNFAINKILSLFE